MNTFQQPKGLKSVFSGIKFTFWFQEQHSIILKCVGSSEGHEALRLVDSQCSRMRRRRVFGWKTPLPTQLLASRNRYVGGKDGGTNGFALTFYMPCGPDMVKYQVHTLTWEDMLVCTCDVLLWCNCVLIGGGDVSVGWLRASHFVVVLMPSAVSRTEALGFPKLERKMKGVQKHCVAKCSDYIKAV